MSTATSTAELAAAELEVLEALEDAGPGGRRRTDLADAVDVDYPETELALMQRGLVDDAGTELVNGDEGRYEYRLVALTERGEAALADARAPDPEPEPVGVRELEPRPSPWNEDDDWRLLSEAVDRLLDETEAVEYDEAEDVVRLVLERAGTTAEVELPLAAWHNNGRPRFFDEYRGAFGEPPGIDNREWGVLQARLVGEYATGDAPADPDGG